MTLQCRSAENLQTLLEKLFILPIQYLCVDISSLEGTQVLSLLSPFSPKIGVLKSFCLVNNKISPAKVSLFLHSTLPNICTLTSLTLSDNNINAHTLPLLTSALTQLPRLRKPNLKGNSMVSGDL